MTVAVLLYHATSDDGRHGHFDVPIDKFADQMNRLVDTGVEFISFAQANDPSLIASARKHVAITFDDGHRSNVPAWEILSSKGIRPAAFIVSDWTKTGRGEHGNDYLTPALVREFSAICDFGCHGASHRSLAGLSTEALNRELSESKAYVEDILGRAVVKMSIPCGASTADVVTAAQWNGFEQIGNSWFDLSRSGSPTVNRLTISGERSGSFPSRLVAHGSLFWGARKSAKAIKRVMTAQFDRPWRGPPAVDLARDDSAPRPSQSETLSLQQ